MELKYVVMIIVKILVSVPTAMLITTKDVNGVALMGGHLDNKNASSSPALLADYELYDDHEISNPNPTIETMNATAESDWKKHEEEQISEEIPDPSPLVVPGYNLPENIFNRGKPFYLERDPLTGTINFDSKPTLSDVEEDGNREYEDNYSNADIYDKANIDRKDSNFGSHKSSDVNQLVPNFHDFLNLPVKYNSDKYVYPLISSSYANTKVQGNVNKHQNHKNYDHLATQKPETAATAASYYYNTKSSPYTTTSVKSTTKTDSNSELEMQNYEEYDEYEYTTRRTNVENIYLTTSKVTLTTTSTVTTTAGPPSRSPIMPAKTTKKPLTLFQQLFGDYEETETEAVPFVEQHHFSEASSTSTTAAPNKALAPENNYYDYDYEEDVIDNSASVKTTKYTPANTTTESITITPFHPETTTEKVTTPTTTKTTTTNKVNSYSTPLRHQTFTSERVAYQNVPSTTIHVPAHQDTASFVVGNHQNMGGEYVGSVVEENVQMNERRPTETTKRPYSGSSITLHPFKHSEASLAIGVPVDRVKGVPGQVVDEKLVENTGEKHVTNKVVFPDERLTGHPPELKPAKLPPNREILKLNSRPMYHQLPSSLTPPKEPDVPLPSKFGASRPPWDPRPDRFFSGRPEYSRPPKPQFDPNPAHKRVDNLPNILPQFRPNVHPSKSYPRPPLFDRQPNRHVAVYEKLQPPPPPPKYLTALRKAAFPDQNEKSLKRPPLEPPNYYHTPPPVILPNRRLGLDEDVEVETLQMIQAKQSEKHEREENKTVDKVSGGNETTNPEKPLYVVYPVNTAPLKLDAFDTTKKETVVIGTRAELPLPPSKINLEHNGDLFNAKDRNDAPILKPHLKPAKSDFPYPLEKPNPSLLNGPPEQADYWNTETKILPNNLHDNRISVTLRTHTERPIAVAYSPTEGNDRYSVPNHAGAVIPEIRPGSVFNQQIGNKNGDREITLTAMMHPQKMQHVLTHRSDGNIETTHVPAQDFEAPFQASVNIDSASQGWSVVREKSKSDAEQSNIEATTVPLATTSEFDIENFKPQLIGGFVPIYDYPEDRGKNKQNSGSQDKRDR